jgi:hypothetical protein
VDCGHVIRSDKLSSVSLRFHVVTSDSHPSSSILRECPGLNYKSRFEKHGAGTGFPEIFSVFLTNRNMRKRFLRDEVSRHKSPVVASFSAKLRTRENVK